MTVRDPGVRGDTERETYRRCVGKKFADCHVPRGGAPLERIAMQRCDPNSRLSSEEPAEVRRPSGRADARTRERDLRQRAGDVREVVQVIPEIVRVRPPVIRHPVGREPRIASVQLGLVSKLEPLDPLLADPADHRLALRRRHLCAVDLKVDTQDQAAVEFLSKRPGELEPPIGDGVSNANRTALVGDRPPREVGALSPEPNYWSLTRCEVAYQLHEHRIDRCRIRSHVVLERPDLERKSDKASGNRAPNRFAVHRHRPPGCGRRGSPCGHGSRGLGRRGHAFVSDASPGVSCGRMANRRWGRAAPGGDNCRGNQRNRNDHGRRHEEYSESHPPNRVMTRVRSTRPGPRTGADLGAAGGCPRRRSGVDTG